MRSLRCLLFAALLASGGCVPAGEHSGSDWALEPVEVPANPGSRWSGLSPDGDGVLLTWLEPNEAGAWSVRMARFDMDTGWEAARVVAVSGNAAFFVNWADFPSAVAVEPDFWVAHWLERGPAGGYDYGVRVAWSRDRGESWSEPWTPHEDGTPTEHGFVSIFPAGDGRAGLVWLDGRETAGHGDDGHGAGGMTLRFRSASAEGFASPEELVDELICDCCQTDAAIAASGPVVVYRNRTEAEIRDVYVTRRVAGEWTPGRAVHDDGWSIPGCPVNGPAVAAVGPRVAVAWFTEAGGEARVQIALSEDSGASFGEPIRVDEGDPVGRVDVLLLSDGTTLVTWLEWDDRESGRVLARRVGSKGELHRAYEITRTSGGRNAGFPRMAQSASGHVFFTWTEPAEGGGARMVRTAEPVGLE